MTWKPRFPGELRYIISTILNAEERCSFVPDNGGLRALELTSLVESVEKDFSTPRPCPVFPPKEMPLYPSAAQGRALMVLPPPSPRLSSTTPDFHYWMTLPTSTSLDSLPFLCSPLPPAWLVHAVLPHEYFSAPRVVSLPPPLLLEKLTLNAYLIQALPL